LAHKSKYFNLLTKLTTSIMNSSDFIYRAKIDYAKGQMFIGAAT